MIISIFCSVVTVQLVTGVMPNITEQSPDLNICVCAAKEAVGDRHDLTLLSPLYVV